jgi:hypothetical protein
MPWDDELKRLSAKVRDTFGEDAWEDAITRALAVWQKAQSAGMDAPYDADAVCYAALKIEFRRILQPH